MKSTKLLLPLEYEEINANDMEQIVGGGWLREASAFFTALWSGILGAFDGFGKGVKATFSEDGINKVGGILAGIAGAITGFAKGFSDGRKFGQDLEESTAEIKSMVKVG